MNLRYRALNKPIWQTLPPHSKPLLFPIFLLIFLGDQIFITTENQRGRNSTQKLIPSCSSCTAVDDVEWSTVVVAVDFNLHYVQRQTSGLLPPTNCYY